MLPMQPHLDFCQLWLVLRIHMAVAYQERHSGHAAIELELALSQSCHYLFQRHEIELLDLAVVRHRHHILGYLHLVQVLNLVLTPRFSLIRHVHLVAQRATRPDGLSRVLRRKRRILPRLPNYAVDGLLPRP
jgi:hypothetical protein